MAIRIEVVRGDITQADAEAIVNAANNHLWMGSGVAGAIKARGGAEVEQEAMAKGPIEVGAAVATTAGKLPYKCVIHAAGMGQDLKTDRETVARVTGNTLRLADRMQLKSLAFPAIGTGVGGFPLEEAAEIMIRVTREFSPEAKHLGRVLFILFDKAGYEAFKNELSRGGS